MLEISGMCNCKPRPTPSEQKLEFDGETSVNPRRYREAMGSLVYVMTCTRPNICWFVTKLSHFLTSPMKPETLDSFKTCTAVLEGDS